ncbi:Rap55 protein, partial [Aphelenchoides avenae]
MSESPGNVYLGQHMSIVSEMLVRYEGFLSAVDGNNHTVTLNRVRCFGTEDRPVELKIDPIQMTYAEITFSASSIREMHLMPMLDETKTSVLSADPAVMSIDAKKLCPPYDINNNKFDQTIGHERKHMPMKDNWRN